MASVEHSYFQQQLTVRRERLQAATARNGAQAEINRLVAEVDAALARLDSGTFGICEVCGGELESERLIADPLTRICLDELPPEELRRLEADLEMAGRIQRALLPPPDLAVRGWEVHYRYEPLGPVSGDYCDLIVANPPGEELYFLLGDVSGKGVAASLLMSHLHAMFRSLAAVGQPLEQMVTTASRLFCESTAAGQYATLVGGRADAQGRVELASAGHPPALLINRSGVKRIESGGFPLGMFCDTNFPTQKFELGPGDSLLFYSDGITESRGAGGEEFGVKRLECVAEERRGASAAELVNGCIAELRSFAGSQRPSDDVTVMALRRAA
ncbi:MAG TPA: SpoIIE family protein phosphatase [Candidatus Acidoferrales bacterium]|nr:SpoIIE family protein phosphatase [Candidatus Acidoferrales bacterium]